MILMLGLLESMLSKPNINIIILFQKKSIHTLENKVLMHQKSRLLLRRHSIALLSRLTLRTYLLISAMVSLSGRLLIALKRVAGDQMNQLVFGIRT
jgi:hypothetical protein